ncbi:MAG: TolC family protein [Gammaproteobacteria bacterium]|nr:TolC family protein [Gammaproteobacteria bacterium]MBU0785347.1 TolC family protein [Gammaproteobacteria bacterium]MBU0815930.1 TolC family protein [Gammaproteobacteria bacterium]MBU1787469.1 TolC family protein [Gammaproteobacteria bacterium]
MSSLSLQARHLAFGILIGGLTLASLADTPAAQAAVTASATDDTVALLPYLSLPPVAATRQVIAALPQVQLARAGASVAQARGQRLEAGVYEWNLKAGTQQRRETTGQQYAEGELAMERSIRWGGKAEKDRELGAAGVLAGELGYADAWHEAVRSLIASWYGWQRERGSVALLLQQTALANEQLAVAQRRVKAGDAPRMDQMTAQAELDRAMAALQQAQGREQAQRSELQKRFPGIAIDTLSTSADLSFETLQLPGDPQLWLKRILEDNHEVELAEAEFHMARLQSERAQLDARPDPMLGVRAARERGGQETVLGVYVTIPLAGAHRKADQRAALALADVAEQRLHQTRQRVEAAAERAVTQASQAIAVARRLLAVQQSMAQVAQLGIKAYGLAELTLTEALQARRAAVEAAQAADSARWDALEAVSRVLVDSHRLWPAEEHGR